MGKLNLTFTYCCHKSVREAIHNQSSKKEEKFYVYTTERPTLNATPQTSIVIGGFLLISNDI